MDRPPQNFELRKIRKPLMEKKRRQRINNSLEYLKRVLLQNTVAISTSGGRVAKLEKADILEMTVRYIQTLHQQLKVEPIDLNGNTSVPGPTVSSTTPDPTLRCVKSREDLYQNLLTEINRPVRRSSNPSSRFNIARDSNSFGREYKEKVKVFVSPMQSNVGVDKENLYPADMGIKLTQSPKDSKCFKETSGNILTENNQQQSDYHWRPW